MAFEMPKVPEGNGRHPISLIVISANNAASADFYAGHFGWHMQPMSAELTAFMPPAGPTGALRAMVPAGFPGMVPYIAVRDVNATLTRIVEAGGAIEKPVWTIPMVGKMARFKDPAGTIYGLTEATVPPGAIPRIPMPVGPNPKPPAGAICHIEMYAADGAAAADFFGKLFGWGTLATMPAYMAFDPGAGLGGIFQSHTPAMPAVAYIYAADVEAMLTAIETAGGKRLGQPMRMPGVGCFGYFKDPSETTMGLIGA